jgi:hypothetical protein
MASIPPGSFRVVDESPTPLLPFSCERVSERRGKTGDRPCAIGFGNACFVCVDDGRLDQRKSIVIRGSGYLPLSCLRP